METFLNGKVTLEDIKISPRLIRLVSSDEMTREMAAEAVKFDGTLLRYVPANIQDEELCLTAMANDLRAIHAVKTELLTEDFYCRVVGELDGKTLMAIPVICRSVRVCEIALERSKENLSSIPCDILPEVVPVYDSIPEYEII